MPRAPITRDVITAALKECGPMSVPEIMEELGWPRNRVNTCLTTARANHPGKFFRITRYRLKKGVKGRKTPIYAAGPGPDAPRPDFGRSHVKARDHAYYLRTRALHATQRRKANGVRQASPWAGLVPIASRTTTKSAI